MSRQMEGSEWPAFGREDMPVDIRDTGDTFEVVADLPGYQRERIDLTLADGRLHIDVDEPLGEADDEPGVRYYRRERHHGSLSRTVRLPEAIDEDAVSARFEDGVLTVALPKAAPGDGHQINID